MTDPESIEQPRPATYYHLARAVLYREFLIFVRYPANAIGGIVVSLFFFGVLFYGGRQLAGQALTESLEGIIVGYFLWTLSVGAYSSVSNDIGSEVQWGTLERHITTPFGFAPVALLKGVAKIVRTFLTSLIVLVAMLLMTGTTLRIEPVTTISVAGLAITSVLGLGFAAGGVTVLYKRIGNWLNLLQFGFIVLISAPVFDAPWTRLLPLAHGSALLQRAMVDGTRIWQFSPFDLALLVGVAVGYLAAGYLVFHYATRRARRLGVLGDY
ncbi:ABC transporter permease [Halapricum desulfuricans]|uniref:ABC-type multidrug transport system, permease component n=1 Tax=Halapricum desulfuricans TaxID=2841257 RepID=A0A897NKX7_9EURY|nr:ABC transporter permease [Halapricum desulfuricans]QSG08576.1 ABC-type multidrug transport system, permease component [Halapricum desulfuricans]QSG11529.1 ABC-type multidrug transport system, permease component [Halapricum desulfuricans]